MQAIACLVVLLHCLADAVDLNFKIDFFASETGYYTIDGQDGVMPEVNLTVGTGYWLMQTDVTNWYHPLGLAYEANGAHDVLYPGGEGAPELADGDNASMKYEYIYYVKYPGDANFTAVTLDDYEPLFFIPLADWAAHEFKIWLKVTDATLAQGIVYFCHIHNHMSGLMHILGGSGSMPTLDPIVTPSEFDMQCGTFSASNYTLGDEKCDGQEFLCGDGLGSDFAQCMAAIDCHMYHNMQTMHVSADYVVTFMHQMIPHHQNAVNMAKILLKRSATFGDDSLGVDISGEEYDGFVHMLMDMVNTQNYQVSEMRKWLLENGHATMSGCRDPDSGRRLQRQRWTRLTSTYADPTTHKRRTVHDAKEQASSRRLTPSPTTFEFRLDFFTGETGYYTVEGFDGVLPNLTLQLGQTYILDQSHVSNWMHPIGLAFQPDGAHDVLYPGGEGAPELADGHNTTGYSYLYFIKYPGDSDFTEVTLDDYEPLFFYPLADWAAHEFKIELTITDASVASSLVYFCHIHNKMSGLLLIEGGTGPSVTNLYVPHTPSSFDAACGTYNVEQYGSAIESYCPSQVFLCGSTSDAFTECMTAIDCKMNYEMSVFNVDANPVVTFMHQMIPHHQNAVNMAKILLKKSATFGDDSLGVDISGEAGEYDGFVYMLMDMVNTQNYQVSEMRKWLLENSYAEIGSRCGDAVELNFKIDFFASETGYYTIDGQDGVMPEVNLTVGTGYWLMQTEVTNWYHPLGLAYEANGAHDVLYPGGEGAPELADGDNASMKYEYIYYVKYPGDANFTAVTLDDYEPLFFIPLADWAAHEFKIWLKVTDATLAQGIVYFCHIHNHMSGLMHILGGSGSMPTLDPIVTPSEFDMQCGTFSASNYTLGDEKCDGQEFLCGDGLGSDFAQCMAAIDCHMYHNMQTMHVSADYVVTFMHQMIPHHQNAVNMAKILLKRSATFGDDSLGVDISGEEYDGFVHMLMDMVNTQNYQVSEMRKWLLENGHATMSGCRDPDSGRRLQRQRWTRLTSTYADPTTHKRRTVHDAKEQASSRRLTPSPTTFEFRLDFFTGETGYYTVEGFDGVLPNLTLQLGQTYILDQSHVSNWMHPIGLAFQPDGAHDVLYPGGEGAPELADGHNTTGYSYLYFIKYPGDSDFTEVTLDDYEPLFFYPLADWAAHEFKIELTITDASVASSLVYFCHIHNKMSGLLLIEGGTGPSVTNLYVPHTPSSFDAACGTYNVEQYGSAIESYCPSQVFLCGSTSDAFTECMTAIDCKMNYEMSVFNVDANPVVTFMHQMIPHHQNAVNMAKILLKKSATFGDDSLGVDISGEAGEYDGFVYMLMDMVNTQNYQVSEMRKWLLENSYAEIGSRCGDAVELNFKIDFFASETGYYTIDGQDGVMPEVNLTVGTGYWLMQTEVTNWYHPLGLAYEANGAHDVLYPGGEGAPELADGDNASMKYEYIYYVKYPGDANFTAVTLDDYEPLFFIPLADWAAHEFKIWLKVTDATLAQGIVYFCHIHNHMSGLMHILGGSGSMPTLDPIVTPSEFDMQCGTFSASNYTLGDEKCDGQEFLCGDGLGSDFAQCMAAIDCHMYHNMQTMHVSADYVVTFMHQMIPHHQNAVNMAKILLKRSATFGDDSLGVDISGEEYDGFVHMLMDMVNTQNYQVSEMRKWLLENGHATMSGCRDPDSGRRLQRQRWTRLTSTYADPTTHKRRTVHDAKEQASSRRLTPSPTTFEFRLDFFTGETGYYTVEGFDGVLPNLTLQLGQTYILDQSHVSNWMHPIGLAFQPDGAHDVLYPGGEGAPELADGHNTTGYSYLYFIKYPGDSDFTEVTLDDYEPLFFYPLADWAAHEFKIELTITDASVASSLVYFCHIHNKMSGLLLIEGGTGPSVTNLYVPHTPSSFDAACGTYNVEQYGSAIESYCPSQVFLCGSTSDAFTECMTAIDCKMNYEMSVFNVDANPVVTFMHQMIPHHQNAVNMAKILLKKSATFGDDSLGVDISGEAGEYDGFVYMLMDMVNTQNYQVSEMRKWLLENGSEEVGARCGFPTTTTTTATTTTTTTVSIVQGNSDTTSSATLVTTTTTETEADVDDDFAAGAVSNAKFFPWLLLLLLAFIVQ